MPVKSFDFAWVLRDSKGYYVTGLYSGFGLDGSLPHPVYGSLDEAARFATLADVAEFLRKMSPAHQRNFNIVRHHPPARRVEEKAA